MIGYIIIPYLNNTLTHHKVMCGCEWFIFYTCTNPPLLICRYFNLNKHKYQSYNEECIVKWKVVFSNYKNAVMSHGSNLHKTTTGIATKKSVILNPTDMIRLSVNICCNVVPTLKVLLFLVYITPMIQ